jgi:hypothetical protein
VVTFLTVNEPEAVVTRPRVGTVGWFDLTVADADRVRDFYKAVVGWTTSAVPMGG